MPSAEAVVLPDNVRPVHYDLTLTPHFDNFTFDGEVDVTLRMEPGTTEIMLNCAEIEIHSATVSWTDTNGEQEHAASNIAYDADAETATISIPETPADGLEGNQHLRMSFTGELNDKLRGFYRSQYSNPEGETAYLATTQFEATDARRAPALLGRAGSQGDIPGDADRTRRHGGSFQHADHRGNPRRKRLEDSAV